MRIRLRPLPPYLPSSGPPTLIYTAGAEMVGANMNGENMVEAGMAEADWRGDMAAAAIAFSRVHK